MSDTDDAEIPDLETLARRYLDLWQDQWAAWAADPEMAENLSRLFQLTGQAFASMMPFGRYPGASTTAGGSAQPLCVMVPNCPFALAAAGFAHPGSNVGGADVTTERTETNAADASAATGATSARPASHSGAEYVAQLLSRIAYLEKRVVALEAGAARPRYRARKGPSPR